MIEGEWGVKRQAVWIAVSSSGVWEEEMQCTTVLVCKVCQRYWDRWRSETVKIVRQRGRELRWFAMQRVVPGWAEGRGGVVTRQSGCVMLNEQAEGRREAVVLLDGPVVVSSIEKKTLLQWKRAVGGRIVDWVFLAWLQCFSKMWKIKIVFASNINLWSGWLITLLSAFIKRKNLSPFTKDFRGGRLICMSICSFWRTFGLPTQLSITQPSSFISHADTVYFIASIYPTPITCSFETRLTPPSSSMPH